ncbi:MAG TPA: cobaltochelatase subunit CobN [Xanthobacteraceae bacterium]|nr:cobaltochelatase subunit CobN [Xanthobacteraceae bacterium]
MHILATSAASLDDIVAPVDLGQPPGDIAVLSFADSDLSGLAAAWSASGVADGATEHGRLPSVRLVQLRDLKHPMSVDLWIDRVGAHAKVIVVRLLGGLDWWRYGVERLSTLARERGIALAVLPGEDRDDPRLAEASTLPPDELATLLRFFREGGHENLGALLRRLAHHAGAELETPAPRPVPRLAAYLPSAGAIDLERLAAALTPGRPVIPIIFYRAMLLAADMTPIDALCAALDARGLAAAPLMVPSLKDADAAAFVRAALARLAPAVIITTTGFAAGGEPGATTPLDDADVPVLQAVIATTKRAAWAESARGLGAADLAMHVVLPELDGRVLAGAIAFKDPLPVHADLAFTALANRPEPDRVEMLAARVAALVGLRAMPRAKRRIAILMPDYPGAPGRTGYAVGLDVPASVLALLDDLRAAGYAVAPSPPSSRALIDALDAPTGDAKLTLDDYAQLLAALPASVADRITSAWGAPADDADVRDGAFRFRAKSFGHAIVALAPDRGRTVDRRADYHDAALPPRHALVAFGLWLQHRAKIDALVHMGAHGTLEWLPGKAVALTQACFPETVLGALPAFYPFIVSNPGEAAQAKRRLAAVTIGHLPPPLVGTGLAGEARELERLLDEYAQADGLDRRRRERLAGLIVDTARRSGLAREAGVASDVAPDEALRRIDAWLCDLKDLAIKDGLHVYGRGATPSARDVSSPSPHPAGEGRGEGAAPQTPNREGTTRGEAASALKGERGCDTAYAASAAAERIALLAALEGRRVAPGPAGSPQRARRDVLPTGRNLFTVDPRGLPTQTAMDLGRLAADEVIRLYLQQHGEMPRALVIDLWGSATLRTGGEEIAQGLCLMGCRPIWDAGTGRVTGIEVLPTAAIGRPRVDVTWRISGLFRDLFPAQIALIDAATRAVATREESDEENPLAAAWRIAGETNRSRIFGTAPGAYGAGVEDLIGADHARDTIGAAYLAAASHAYAGADGAARSLPGGFAARVAAADLLLHTSDDPGRDLLEGDADVSHVGGFAAAAAALGRAPDLLMLDATDPRRPRARPLGQAIARLVHARAVNPRFIAGQMRHGPRGAAELAETVDRLVGFMQTTDAVPGELLDLVHAAYVADPQVRAFLLAENPAAARAIAERLEFARRRGLWHPRRNDIDADLAALRPEAGA